MPDHDSTWVEYSQHVLKSLEKLSANLDKLDDKVSAINDRLITLEVRAAFWGGLGGLVIGGVVAFVMDRVLR